MISDLNQFGALIDVLENLSHSGQINVYMYALQVQMEEQLKKEYPKKLAPYEKVVINEKVQSQMGDIYEIVSNRLKLDASTMAGLYLAAKLSNGDSIQQETFTEYQLIRKQTSMPMKAYIEKHIPGACYEDALKVLGQFKDFKKELEKK